jgi:hypothetical protein
MEALAVAALGPIPDDHVDVPAVTWLDNITHLEHYLLSLSPAIPSELESSGQKPPRWHAENQHAEDPWNTLAAAQAWILQKEKGVKTAADSCRLGLAQHWIDFPGRKLSGATKSQVKKLAGAVMMADSPITETAARSMFASYADRATDKLEVKIEGRLDAVEQSQRSLETVVTTQIANLGTSLGARIDAASAGRNRQQGGGGYRQPYRDQQQPFRQQQQQQFRPPSAAAAAAAAVQTSAAAAVPPAAAAEPVRRSSTDGTCREVGSWSWGSEDCWPQWSDNLLLQLWRQPL